MKISDLGEFGLIERIRKTAGSGSRGVAVGIGDDAAVLARARGLSLLATTDMLLEGVHFDLATTQMDDLGWKSAAANLSDIAAMGGAPRFSLVGLGMPPHLTTRDVAAFFRGFLRLCRKHDVRLVGGDTCGSRAGLVISVTVLGEARRKEVVARSGARPGDLIFVTGTTGDSGAGLELLRNAYCGLRNRKSERQGSGRCQEVRSAIRNPRSAMGYLVSRHLKPVPRVEWGRAIGRAGVASAMIDVSDGISSDLGHICEESGTGAVIDAARIPLSRQLRSAPGLTKEPLQYALHGGEDYELLFTVPPAKAAVFRKLGVPATEIGTITKRRGMRIIDPDGRERRLARAGYDHFRNRSAGARV